MFLQTSIDPFSSPVLAAIEMGRNSINYSYTESFACIQKNKKRSLRLVVVIFVQVTKFIVREESKAV